VGRYAGGIRSATPPTTKGRCAVAHGPFVEAWLRVRGGGAAARDQARARFLAPLLAHLDGAGLAISPRSPTATRRIAPAVARSKRGRSARRCG